MGMEKSMNIEIEKEVEFDFGFDENELIKKVVEGCLDFEECPFEIKLSVTITNNDEIKKINNEFREINKATDVLSFPMVDYEVPGDFSFLEKDDDFVYGFFDPDTGELILGDIVFSYEKAVEQSEEYGHSLLREVAFLVAHSMFHLFGYDHMEEDERIIMEQKQNQVLEKLEIRR